MASNTLELFSHRRESPFDRRDSFHFSVHVLSLLLPPGIYLPICASYLDTLWEATSGFLSSVFPQTIFSGLAFYTLYVIQSVL